MQNLKMFCICIHNQLLDKVKLLNYIPVGLGDDKFDTGWIKDNYGDNISEKNKIETAIKIFFDGFHKKDSLIIKSVIENSFELKSVSFQNENAFINNLNGDKFISAVVNRNEAPVWNEKLISFEIKIDGPLANAWVEYEFWLDDKLSHCGVNSFHLLKKESGWKIFTITDSRRKNCSK